MACRAVLVACLPSQTGCYLCLLGGFLFFSGPAHAGSSDILRFAGNANVFARPDLPPLDLEFSRQLAFSPALPDASAGEAIRYYRLKSDGTNWFAISSRTPIDDGRLISTNYLFFFGKSGGRLWQIAPATGILSEWADVTGFDRPSATGTDPADFFRTFELEVTEPLRLGVLQSVPGTLKFAPDGAFTARSVTGGDITGRVAQAAVAGEMTIHYACQPDKLAGFSLLADTHDFAGLLPEKISVYQETSGASPKLLVDYSITRAVTPSSVAILTSAAFAPYCRTTFTLSNAQYYALIDGAMVSRSKLATTGPQMAQAIFVWTLPYLLTLVFLVLCLTAFLRRRPENKTTPKTI